MDSGVFVRSLRHCRSWGFSLIEVVLALGVLAFAILSIVALLPIGLQNNRDSHEESVGTNIIAALIADWQSQQVASTNAAAATTPLFQLPRLQPGLSSSALSNTILIGDDGQIAPLATARYRVSYNIVPPSSTNSFAPYYIGFIVSWPAQATNKVSTVESMAAIASQ